jgi:alkylated DNA repair protein alkB family protein 6
MPHKDGPAYHPVVCTVSLGSSLCLDVYATTSEGARENQPFTKILQEPRSLLITTEDLYTEHMHGISEIDCDVGLGPETVANWHMLRSPGEYAGSQFDRNTRTSLTYRDVLKVSKLGNKLGIFGKR